MTVLTEPVREQAADWPNKHAASKPLFPPPAIAFPVAPFLSTAQPMWCPSCQRRSPLVAIQPEGLVCARCQVEVEFGQPADPAGSRAAPLAGPRLRVAAAAAELQLGWVEDATLSTLEEFQSLSAGSGRGSRTASTATSAAQLASAASQATAESQASGPVKPPTALTGFPADQPVYRFDGAHPPVGGRTQAAIERQRIRYSAGAAGQGSKLPPGTARPTDSAADRDPFAPLAGNSATASRTGGFPVSAPAVVASAEPVAPVKPGPLSHSAAKAAAGGESSSEFAIRPLPRSFLLPRSINPWPGRLCSLSGALFIAGQSWLLWSFLRGQAVGVAGGILASAGALAIAFYVIARYGDEDLERR